MANAVPEDETIDDPLGQRAGEAVQEDHGMFSVGELYIPNVSPKLPLLTLSFQGDTSTYTFLRHISGQLNLMGRTLPRNILSEEDDLEDNPSAPLVLPERCRALEYLNCFFDHLNGTYRYLSRRFMVDLLEKIYNDDNETLGDPASVALFLSVIGSG